MGVHRKKNFIFVKSILDSLINGSTQEKVLTYLFFFHRTIVRKRVHKIPHLRKHKIVKQW